MSFAAVALTASLATGSHQAVASPPPVKTVIQLVNRADSWAAITADMEAALLHREHVAHVQHVEHENHLKNEAERPSAQPLPPWDSVDTAGSYVPSGGGSGPSGAVPVTTAHYQPPKSTTPASTASEQFQACVIAAESGGNADIWNGSGHWGLYQFSASTWAAFGGDPAKFGNATVAEQNAVFWNVMAAGDWYGTWGEWDGCVLG